MSVLIGQCGAPAAEGRVDLVGFAIRTAAQRGALGGRPVLGATTTVKNAIGAALAKTVRGAAAYAGDSVLSLPKPSPLSRTG
jgi:hypothetical protein